MVLAAFVCFAAYVAAERLATVRWLTYTGAWFKIDYPQGFSVAPLNKSSTSSDGFDGVKFGSKNKGVEFYVYSPQSGGLESDFLREIAADPTSETLEFDSTTAKYYSLAGKIIETNAIVTRLIRIAAKNGSYKRDYEVTVDLVEPSRLIFGIRYPEQRTYERFKPAYDRFRHSLVRYAD